MKRKIIVSVLVLITAIIILVLLYLNQKEIQSISIQGISIDFITGEITGSIPKTIKPDKELMDEYYIYINKLIPEIKKNSYNYMTHYDYPEDALIPATYRIWNIRIYYYNDDPNVIYNQKGSWEDLWGDYAYPEQWEEFIERTNELIGQDLLDSSTHGYLIE